MSVNDASRIIIDDSRVMLQILASLNDDSTDIIYNCNMFIVLTTGENIEQIFRHRHPLHSRGGGSLQQSIYLYDYG